VKTCDFCTEVEECDPRKSRALCEIALTDFRHVTLSLIDVISIKFDCHQRLVESLFTSKTLKPGSVERCLS
jgi:hypothetical protein